MSQALPPSLSEMKEAIHLAFKLWHEHDGAGSPLQSSRLFQRAQQDGHASVRHATNQLLLQALEILQSKYPTEADILRLRFQEELPAQTVANKLNLAVGTVWNKQEQAITHHAEILYELERQTRTGQRAAMLARLEAPTYTQLFGVTAQVKTLAEQLGRTEPPWLIALAGLGGQGKTALADLLARHLIDQDRWADFAWVTARQQIFNLGGGLRPVEKPSLSIEVLVDALLGQLMADLPPRPGAPLAEKLALLQTRLKARPHLIVIDNLETQQDVASLIATLRTLAGPTKFLLTTRQRLYSEPDIFHYALPELSEHDAFGLVRLEAQMRNLPDLTAASDQELQPIYATVGGNPLALRLVVGQLHVHPLDRVLDDLKAARGQTVEHLYTFIYQRAWASLDEPARRALLMLPLITPGIGTLDRLAALSKVDASELRQVLDTLVALNLVDSRGGLHERYYTIHSLTRTFLQEQVLKWGNNNE